MRNQVIISARPISVGLEGAVLRAQRLAQKVKPPPAARTIGVMAIRIAGNRVISVRT